MSNFKNPGKQFLMKVSQYPGNVQKILISYDPKYADTLNWTREEQNLLLAASQKEAKLSDKLMLLHILALKYEGKSLEVPKIIVTH